MPLCISLASTLCALHAPCDRTYCTPRLHPPHPHHCTHRTPPLHPPHPPTAPPKNTTKTQHTHICLMVVCHCVLCFCCVLLGCSGGVQWVQSRGAVGAVAGTFQSAVCVALWCGGWSPLVRRGALVGVHRVACSSIQCSSSFSVRRTASHVDAWFSCATGPRWHRHAGKLSRQEVSLLRLMELHVEPLAC